MPARLRNGVLTVLVALASIVGLAACVGSSEPKHASTHGSPFIAFSKCMRTHGVTNFPDPGGRGGISLDGTEINPESPSFQAAQSTCFKLMPGGGPLNHKASAHQIALARETAECMRRHGVPGFPDPIISNELPTSLNQLNYSSITASGGIIIAIPKTIDAQSPAFEKAARACNYRD